MTVSAAIRRVLYVGNGVSTEFAVPFQFFEIDVLIDDAVAVPSSYSISQSAPGTSGAVVFVAAPAAGVSIEIAGSTVVKQETDYVENDDFPASSHEAALDRLTMIAQEIKEVIGTVAVPDEVLPDVLTSADDPFVVIVKDSKPYITPASNLLSAGQYSLIGRGMNVGDIVMHATTDVPSGWIRIKRDPQAVLKSSYPEYDAKCAAAGYPYGSTSTHVNVPGGAGLFPRIWDNTSTHDADATSRLDHLNAATVVGNVVGSRQLNQNKEHDHGGATSDDAIGDLNVHAAVGSLSAGSAQYLRNNNAALNPVSSATGGIHDHTIDPDGGTDARPDNIAFPFIMLLSPAEATDAHTSIGLPYNFDTSNVDGNPGDGEVRTNAANMSAATMLYVSRKQAFGQDISAIIAAYNAIGGSPRGQIIISALSSPTTTLIAQVMGSVVTTDPNYLKIPIEVVAANPATGAFASGQKISVHFVVSGIRGPQGDPGADGPPGPTGAAAPLSLDMLWSALTSGDPGSGGVRINHATPASLTSVAFSETDRLGHIKSALIASFDDSTNSKKARVEIIDVLDTSKWLSLYITSAITDNGGWDSFTAQYIDAGNALTAGNRISVLVTPIGDTGDVSAPSTFGAADRLILANSSAKDVKSTDKATINSNGLLTLSGAGVAHTGYGAASMVVDLNDLGLSATLSGAILTCTAGDFRINGQSGGVDGRVITLVNAKASTDWVQLSDEHASATAAHRFALGGRTVFIGPGQSCILRYNGTDSRWHRIGGSASNRMMKKLNADQSNSTITVANLGNLRFLSDAGHFYRVRAYLCYTAAATTTGVRAGLGEPGFGGTNFVAVYNFRGTLTATTELINYGSATLPQILTTTSLTVGNTVDLEANLHTVSPAGVITVQFASEVAASAIVMKQDQCWLEVEDIT